MNKITRYSALFLMLFAVIFTSCEEDQDTDIPSITLSGSNPMVYDTINSEYVEPGVSTSEGTLIVDKSALYMNKRGESTVYYSAIDDNNNVGHASRKVIVKNPSEVMEGTYNVEVKDGSGNIIDMYIDQISADDYINGKIRLNNFDGTVCDVNTPIYAQFDWNNQTFDIIPGQSFNGQSVSNNTGSAYTFNGNSFDMTVNTGGLDKIFSYHKVGEPQTSSITMVHASGDAGTVTYLIDNEARNATSPLQILNYENDVITEGMHSIKFNTSGCINLTATTTWFDANKSYSVFLTGNQSSSNLENIILENDLSAPSAGNARVRFLHAADGLSNLDILNDADATVFFSNVAFKSNLTNEIPAGAYTLRITNPGDPNQLPNTTLTPVTFEAGKSYTIYSYQYVGGTAGLALIQHN